MLSFQDLTAKTQSRLIMENMQMCYSLTMSYYFFGHNATTAVEQVGIRGNIPDKKGIYFLLLQHSMYTIYMYILLRTTGLFQEEHTGILTGKLK